MISAGMLERALKKVEETVSVPPPEEVRLELDLPDPLLQEFFKAIKGLFYPERERKGKFLVITGIDKSGKDTHCFNPLRLKGVRPIFSLLKEMGYSVLGLKQPSYDTVLGRLVASYLGLGSLIEGRLSKEFAWMLWSLDRAQHNARVIDWLREEGNAVLSKRWCESNIVYQMAQGIDVERIERFERGIAKQDYTILLDLPAEESLKRSRSPDRYETLGLLKRIRGLYLELPLHYPYGELFVVNASRSLKEVNLDLISLVEGLFKGDPSSALSR